MSDPRSERKTFANDPVRWILIVMAVLAVGWMVHACETENGRVEAQGEVVYVA